MKKSLTQSSLRFGVVGAGIMGRNHLRVLKSLKNVDVVGVVEPDPQRRAFAVDTYECEGFATVEELVGRVDAVCVVSPTETHEKIGTHLLKNGIHCLIEKPLAATEAECLALIEAAERADVVLLVGHIERFNPAVQQLSEMLKEGHRKIQAIDVKRMSSASSRIVDVDVVMDLMVHDLDIVLTLMADKVVDITARGVYSGGGRGKDYVTALLTFESGALACVTASRITENRIREMLVTSDLGCIALDYASQRIAVYKQNRPEFETGLGNYQFDLSMGRVLVRPGEPLVLELKHFVDCIVARKPPLVNGTAALEALRLVWEIQRRIELGNSFG